MFVDRGSFIYGKFNGARFTPAEVGAALERMPHLQRPTDQEHLKALKAGA